MLLNMSLFSPFKVQGDEKLMHPVMDSTDLEVQFKAVNRKCQTLPQKADVCTLLPMTCLEQIFQSVRQLLCMLQC